MTHDLYEKIWLSTLEFDNSIQQDIFCEGTRKLLHEYDTPDCSINEYEVEYFGEKYYFTFHNNSLAYFHKGVL